MNFAEPVGTESRPIAAPRILFVDDAEDLCEVVTELLSLQGFTVVTAHAIPQAIERLHQSDFQLVLSDFRVGEAADPWTALSDIQRTAAPSPMGIVTGWKLTPAQVQRRGFAFLLPKPFDAEVLFAVVGQYVKGRTLDGASAETIRAYFTALTERNWEALASLCTEDVLYHLPGNDPRFSRSIQGRGEFRWFSEETFRDFPEAAFSIDALIPLPSAVVARYRGSWMASPEKRVESTGSVLFHFRGNAICQIGVRLELKQLLARASSAPTLDNP